MLKQGVMTLILIAIFLSGAHWIHSIYKSTTPTLVTIGLAGDVMLGRMVDEELTNKLVPQLGYSAYSKIWGTALPLLQANDLNLVNLETTLTRSTQRIPKVFNFKSDPRNVHALVAANIHVVNLANNHSKDFDDQGLLETISTLAHAGIKSVGAGANSAIARSPVIIQKKDITIGILGATDNEGRWAATNTNPGINYFSVDNLTQLLADIQILKKKVDLVIVSLHWGPNMRTRPTQDFVDAAHKLVDAGADIIHGHSAHLFHGIEQYKKSIILYDTGDFLDDYRIDHMLRNDRSFLFVAEVTKKGIQALRLIPIIISNMQVNQLTGSEADAAIARMQTLSLPFGTIVTSIKAGQAYLAIQ